MSSGAASASGATGTSSTEVHFETPLACIKIFRTRLDRIVQFVNKKKLTGHQQGSALLQQQLGGKRT